MADDGADMDDQALGGTTYDRVHAAILRDIIAGVFPPGARLRTADLCERYGLSQMPIREALQRLQGEGVVTVIPNRGARVRSITAKFIEDVYELRGVLSIVIYRDLFAHPDPKLVPRLIEAQERYDAALAAGDEKACDDENKNFHGYIRAQCRNEEVAKVMDRGNQLVAGFRSAVGYGPKRRKEQSEEHWAIIRAIETGNLQLSIEADERHRNNGVRDVIAMFRKKFENA